MAYDSSFLNTLINCIDHTLLSEPLNETQIFSFCEPAKGLIKEGKTIYPPVAAVCLPVSALFYAKQALHGTSVQIATIINFPEGTHLLQNVLAECEEALASGADELDVVFPYQLFLAGRRQETQEFLKACRSACPTNKILKIILETGAFINEEELRAACYLAIDAKCNFIKTSTGKIKQGATLNAVKIMAEAIIASPGVTGIKVSGGVRSIEDAQSYWKLLSHYFELTWFSNKNLRFGSSNLLLECIPALSPASAEISFGNLPRY